MRALHLGRVPLGSWGWQAFIGRLESQRSLSPILQDPLEKQSRLAQSGNPQGPLMNGLKENAAY